MTKTKEYTNNEVTVVWKPELCMHSKNCVHGLQEVFKPTEKPWIQPENASTENIIKTVDNCPSGALSYYMNATGKPENKTVNTAEGVKVEVVNLGPLMVHGSLNVKYDDGHEEKKSRVTAFCRCGDSTNKPFCDGSHKQHEWK